MKYYIGIMSGTSLDGIDVVLVDEDLKLISDISSPFPIELKQILLKLQSPSDNEIHNMCIAENLLAVEYAKLVNQIKKSYNIIAIGSHGQTIRHHPHKDINCSYTLQIQNPSLLAELTNIDVISNFRQADIASGGQGAPLVPAFHYYLFSDLLRYYENIIICNIGGMSNISMISKDKVLGYDCGCGNVLLDSWIKQELNLDFDKNGDWARTGNLNHQLLDMFLDNEYFKLPPPKSTGRELFNIEFINNTIENFPNIANQDVQNTLTHLTAKSIANEIQKLNNPILIVCGGGAKNSYLLELLSKYSNIQTSTTNDFGIDAQHIESMAFARLAKQYTENKPSNLPDVTGAKNFKILGGLFKAFPPNS